MNKTVAFLGIGNRGYIYAKYAKEDNISITAICDTDENSLSVTARELGVNESCLYKNEDDFFKAGKLADLLFISTPDSVHTSQCISALKLGYDIVIEKPVAVNVKELKALDLTARKCKRKVVVCHVLRYTDFYRKIKEIVSNGTIGNILHFSQSENVGWWHYTQSFTRGKWRNSNTSSPMILAKCCHDLDMINWLLNDNCVRVASLGEQTYFNKNNAPVGSAKYCFECKYQDTCLYSCIRRSVEMPGTMNVPYGFTYTEQEIRDYLSDKTNSYAKCVYRSDNNVVDHQSLIMQYEKGTTVSMNMHALAQSTYRHTKITGTKGEIDSIFSDEGDSVIKLSLFKPVDEFKVQEIVFKKGESGHGGGDRNFFESAIEYIFDGKQNDDISELNVSLSSHYIAFAAEKSRLKHGKPMKL